MALGHDQARVRVPATSANLGPGFDALGLALALHDDLEVRVLPSGVSVQVTGEGAGEVPDGEQHLVLRALRLALDHVGAPQPGLALTCVNRIPHGRGLGSSAAAAVGGLLLARGLLADPAALDDDTVLALATRLEGHPDNAAPALLGGATIAWVEQADGTAPRPRAVRFPVHQEVVPVVLVPQERLSTQHARSVLPAVVTHRDAAFQAGRAALLVEALGRRPDLLLPATEDRLHQEHRREVMSDSLALVDELRAQGVAAVVSGAGPTVLALTRRAGEGMDADEALARALSTRAGAWRLLRPGVDDEGGQVRSGA
ncbi:homoserine kinase [Cellulomonas chengniuliangii]|uniref:homoserine kinase n=1 Tax=Cellulomonas chengniuliangii TaxID=2968084 RepID=UPI001D0E6440|nr:homoserine kinase [Cellulomonas chengniuliangii]MCC2316353.1 homoserine kinase [Cellulomonas chengniuliangii]